MCDCRVRLLLFLYSTPTNSCLRHMNLRCVWGYMQGMVLPHKIYLCDELYGNIEVQKTCAPTSKERHILDLICIKILTGCHLENCLFQSTYNDFSLNAFDYSMYKYLSSY